MALRQNFGGNRKNLHIIGRIEFFGAVKRPSQKEWGMAEDDGLKLAELLCARICHDLAGPVGAVGTGAELLAEEAESGVLAGDALDLLTRSAAAAGSRLRFLRLAWGSGNQVIDGASLAAIATTYLREVGERLSLDWPQPDQDHPWPPAEARLLLNLLIIARDCLPRGGVIHIRTDQSPEVFAEVTAAGPGARPGDAAQAMAAAGSEGLAARGVQGYYTRRLAHSLYLRPQRLDSIDRVVFRTEAASPTVARDR
jgi:histidine phosphotransferase ChpT